MKGVFTLFAFCFFLVTVSSQDFLRMEVRAIDNPGIYGYASCYHNFEKHFDSGPIGNNYLYGYAASNGAVASAALGIYPNYDKTKPGARLFAEAYTKKGAPGKGKAGTMSKKGVYGPALFSVTFTSRIDFSGHLKVVFAGNLMDKNGFIKAGFGTCKKSVNVLGSFNYSTEIPVTLKAGTPLTFKFWIEGFSSSYYTLMPVGYRSHIEFNLASTLVFETFGKGCKGRIGALGKPDYGKPFTITLTGGEKNVFTILVAGNSDKKFGNLHLPFDLTPFGAPGCMVYTNEVGLFTTRSNNSGNASFSSIIPPSWQIPGLPAVYFQWVQRSNSNSLGIVLSNAGKLHSM